MRVEPSDIPSAGDKALRAWWEGEQLRKPRPGALQGEDERKDKDGPNEPEKENDDGLQR